MISCVSGGNAICNRDIMTGSLIKEDTCEQAGGGPIDNNKQIEIDHEFGEDLKLDYQDEADRNIQ